MTAAGGPILAHEKPRERVMMLAAANVRFAIPAGDRIIVEARVTLHEEATLVSLLPHMHLRGNRSSSAWHIPTGEGNAA